MACCFVDRPDIRERRSGKRNKSPMAAEEHVPEPTNPLGIDGLEFIEYATSQPQAFGALLQRMGFAAVARHRSREVMLYRQGSMNLIVNSHSVTEPTPTVAL